MFSALLIASLTLNLGLAAWLLCSRPQTVKPENAAVADNSVVTAETRIPEDSHKALRIAGHSTALFDWRQVESADYRRYVSNLRAIGSPEQTVRDIIMADLTQVYAARAQATWSAAPIREFWQKETGRPDPSSEQRELLRNLEEEKQSVMDEVIGARFKRLEWATALLMSLDTTYLGLAFLPDEKREAAYQPLCEANVGYLRQNDRRTEQGRQLQELQAAALSSILSPDELEEFRMRIDPAANELRSIMTSFEGTPEEFKALVKLREEMRDPANRPGNPYLQREAEVAAFGRLFGDARAREYAKRTDSLYVWARRVVERYGLSDDAADRAWEIKRDAITLVQQIHGDATLSETERRQRLEALHRTTESRLVEVLGAKGTAVARRGDWWLQDPTLEFRQ